MIIDSHVHLVGLAPETGCFLSKRMSGGFVFRALKLILGIKGNTPQELDRALLERMEEWVRTSDVDAIGLLAFDGVYDANGMLDRNRTHLYVANDYCLKVCATNDAFLPICSVNPNRHDAIEELERVVDAGSVAIKTLPNSQDFDPADPRHAPFFKRMAELEIPLLTHTSFEHTIPPYNQLYGRPERLIPVLEQGTTVIAAHCASSGVAHLKEDIGIWFEMIEKYDNLYGDISAMGSVSRFKYIHQILNNPKALERVILGSDFPVPTSPMLFASKIGFQNARQITKDKNPIQKNYRLFQELGVPESVMTRAQHILRMP